MANKASVELKDRILILVGVPAVIFIIVGYYASQQTMEKRYLSAVDRIEQSSANQIASINSEIKNFKEDPTSIQTAKAKFADGQKQLKDTVSRLKETTPPQRYTQFHEDLLAYYSDTLNVCSTLYDQTDYVETRGLYLGKFYDAERAFVMKVKTAKTDADLLSAIEAFKKATNNALQSLTHVLDPNISVYSANALEDYLKSVLKALGQFKDLVREKRDEKYQAKLEEIGNLFAKDPAKALFQKDNNGIVALKTLINRVEEDRKRLDKDRKSLR